MRRLKMLLMSAVLAVAMLVALSGPAMAHDCCFDRFVGSPFLVGDPFIDDRDVVFLDEDCDVEDVDEFGNIIFVVVDCD
jgi:hypothetical protein